MKELVLARNEPMKLNYKKASLLILPVCACCLSLRDLFTCAELREGMGDT
ncbi:UNVERIFIED_CONTAM: hypothetical protein FKN15_074627 [Acipenser sinensis]